MTDVYPGTCEQIVWPATVEASCKAGKLVDLSDEARDYVDEAYNDIAYAIADYEASAEVNQFSSRYDAYLAGDETALTNQEVSGLLLFTGEALCSACHLAEQREDGEPPLFTDYTFDNLGVPKNPDNPEYVENPGFIDEGLGGFLATRTDGWHAYAAQNRGKHKVPTLRNVALSPGKGFTKAFMHNGYFKTLEGVVHFYNTRDVNPSCESLGLLDATEAQALKNNCWPDPEVAENVNSDELGDLGLTPEQEAALVAFMRALSDGYVPKPGKAPTR
jgi:cytochrome c peroxidase